MANFKSSVDACATCGALLKLLRRRARLSQLQLSVAVGYSESHISRIENDERPIDRASLLALFVPALDIKDEPLVIERLLALCDTGRAHATSPAESARAGYLPAALTSFVGRGEEMAELVELLRARNTRLVTLTGSGGCGKTRLALAVGEALAHDYANGVWLTELSALTDPHFVPKAIANTFKLSESEDSARVSALANYLQPKRALVLLDNCEHLIDAVAEVVATLLRECPHLHILATSREALDIPGEVNYRVQPLALPSVRQGERVSRDAIESFDAIRLFADRAATARRGFSLDDQNAAAIVRLCSRLDGIPLALELAAAWMSVLSPEQVIERLDADLALPNRISRGVMPRHQTLAAAMEWSYGLLSADEQALLRQLSVFAGGWTLDEAQSVFGSAHTLELLRRLTSKSLVTVEHAPGGQSRYRMLDTIREFARQKLAAHGEEDRARDRHLDYFVGLAEAAEPALKSSQQLVWLTRLDQAHDNLRAALDWSVDSAKPEAALRMTGALAHFWEMRSNLSEGKRWSDIALRAAAGRPDLANAACKAKALYSFGLMTAYLWEPETSRASLDESLRICQANGDLSTASANLCFIAIAESRLQQPDQAVRTFHAALDAARRAEDAWWIAENFH